MPHETGENGRLPEDHPCRATPVEVMDRERWIRAQEKSLTNHGCPPQECGCSPGEYRKSVAADSHILDWELRAAWREVSTLKQALVRERSYYKEHLDFETNRANVLDNENRKLKDNAAALERRAILAEESYKSYTQSMEAELENAREILDVPFLSHSTLREIRDKLETADVLERKLMRAEEDRAEYAQALGAARTMQDGLDQEYRTLAKENKRLNQIIGVGPLQKLENYKEQVMQRQDAIERLKEELRAVRASLAGVPLSHTEAEAKADRDQLANVTEALKDMTRQRDAALKLYAKILDKLDEAQGDLERKEPYIRYLEKAHGGAVDRCRAYEQEVADLKRSHEGCEVLSGVWRVAKDITSRIVVLDENNRLLMQIFVKPAR